MLCLASARGSTFSIISYPLPLCQVLRGKKHDFFQTLFLNKADASSEMRRRSSEFDNHPFREEHRDAVTATLRYDTTKPSLDVYKRQTLSPDVFQRRWLEFQYQKSGIPTSTPQRLTPLFLSLPHILYIQYQNPVSSYSEAPWGLSVLLRVAGIFTSTTISPGRLSRQCPNRYAIRALSLIHI